MYKRAAMGPSRSSRCLSFILLALLVCQAFVLPTLARTLVEKKLLVTAQTIGSQKSVSTQGWGYGPGWGYGRGRGSGGGGGGGGGSWGGGGGGGGGGAGGGGGGGGGH